MFARRSDDKDDVEVRLEDQQRINMFGRLNGRLHDVEDDLKAKQSQFELLDDAANEIILADDEEPIMCAPARFARLSCARTRPRTCAFQTG